MRRSTRKTFRDWYNFRKMISGRPPAKQAKSQDNHFIKIRRYVRETKSMLSLKEQFEKIEEIIKKIQIATLCSKEKDIYPR